MLKSSLAEFLGTFVMVFVGTGAVVLGFSHLLVSICFGIAVMCMILLFGKQSGAHINPAVTIAFAIVENRRHLMLYIPFQLLGAVFASFLLFIIWPERSNYGQTLPEIGIANTVFVEISITFLLLLVIFLVIKTKNLLVTSLVVGGQIFFTSFFIGPFTGASMNPARSMGPAIFSNSLSVFWIYALGPLVGSLLAVLAEKKVLKSIFPGT
ncbi:MAG: aquaporin [Bacteroidota bacterium]